jgi:hypothetical protein
VLSDTPDGPVGCCPFATVNGVQIARQSAARAKDLAGRLLLVGRVQRSSARIDEYLVARDVADGDGCASTSLVGLGVSGAAAATGHQREHAHPGRDRPGIPATAFVIMFLLASSSYLAWLGTTSRASC